MDAYQAVVSKDTSGKRLDQFLAEALPAFSRSALATAIKNGHCLLDGTVTVRPNQRLKEGNAIELRIPDAQTKLLHESGPVDIVWHDDDLCVVNKEPGITVHPCPSCPSGTLIQRLLPLFPSLASMEGERPGIVHRIDKDTSGLLLVALHESMRLALTDLFSQRAIQKIYLALVRGVPEEKGSSTLPIGRHPTSKTKMTVLPEHHGGKPAHTEWQRLWVANDGTCSLLRIAIHTGRTHQIRVHMANAGHPLLGDAVYADAKTASMAKRQMLHAWQLSFQHPFCHTQKHFLAPPPDDFLNTALLHTHTLQRIVITGNPGSGKSTVRALFAQKGIPTFSADQAVTELYKPHGPLAEWLREHGGNAIVTEGAIDRDKLFLAFQTDPLFKRDMEKFIHTSVKTMLEAFWLQHASEKLAFAEIPLWLECGWQEKAVLTLFVRCPQPIRFDRLSKTRHWSKEKASTIESWQWPEDKKEAACDFGLDNSQGPKELEKAC
ncbi:MAG: dephospho-CoA kinase, partial [Desulfovibrio sp.]|nr:dephospho-CoA kinase [Desulfovibrio sp.]